MYNASDNVVHEGQMFTEIPSLEGEWLKGIFAREASTCGPSTRKVMSRPGKVRFRKPTGKWISPTWNCHQTHVKTHFLYLKGPTDFVAEKDVEYTLTSSSNVFFFETWLIGCSRTMMKSWSMKFCWLVLQPGCLYWSNFVRTTLDRDFPNLRDHCRNGFIYDLLYIVEYLIQYEEFPFG